MKKGIGQALVGDFLSTAAIRFGEREAFVCSETGRRFTFRETHERCNRLANALTGLGLQKGDVVAMLSRNRVEVVETFFAWARTGLVGMPLNYRLTARETCDLLNSIGAKALICEPCFDEVLQRVTDAVPSLRHVVLIGSEPLGVHAGYEALLAAAPSADPVAEIEESDPFYFNLTSGTSGLPKCYVLTQYNNVNAMTMFLPMELTSRDVALTVFPMFGRVGFVWAAAGMMHGMRNVLANFDPGRVLQLIESERITIMNLVPTMAALLLAHEGVGQRDLTSLRATVFAGSSLPEPILKGVMERICPNLYEYYGMQETGALVMSTPEDRLRRPGSVGRAMLHVELRVVDEIGRPVRPGEIGEVISRSPAGVTSYHDNQAKSAETFRDGWIHTGDLASMDEEGYLFLRGRRKDLIITGGQNVFASEVEGAILACPDVLECAVIGLPDPVWGESVGAVVVVQPGSTVTAQTLREHCRDRLASFKTPRQYFVQEEPLPKTPTGKVQKFILVNLHKV
jgi:fatty-acyl-CoA synthase